MFTDNYFFYIFLWKNLEIRQFIRIFAIALGKNALPKLQFIIEN